jgi:hypothetical protein
VKAELTRDAATPLELGAHIAWTLPGYLETTDRFSEVHRVGNPLLELSRTLCGEMIPPVVRRVPLSPRVMTSLGRCRYCEDLYVQLQRETAHDGSPLVR